MQLATTAKKALNCIVPWMAIYVLRNNKIAWVVNPYSNVLEICNTISNNKSSVADYRNSILFHIVL